jgi:citrate synthase
VTLGTPHEVTFRTLEAIEARFTERMAEQGKALYANVEFYKGLVFRAMGLPPRFFTALFAMARVFGYLAHFSESRQDNRIVRPQAHYVGPAVRRAGT